jgi:predicted GNAT superfamily acetyltransferase
MEGRIDPPSSLNAMSEDDLREKAKRETLILALDADANDALVGCAYADLRPNCVYIGKLAVAAQARGNGVARALLSAADTHARAHGRNLLELQTRVELTENHATFASLGFRKTGETAHEGYARATSVTMQRAVR